LATNIVIAIFLAPIAADILATQNRDKGEKREPAPKNRRNF
jgi:hypothetical protein